MFAPWGLSGRETGPYFCFALHNHGSVVRPFISKMESTARAEKEAKDAQLAANVRQADLQQLTAKLDSDFELLKALKPDESSEAHEHAKDMKYLRDRQQ